jgi:nucleoside-diphosphate-sugar epimerase
MPFSISLCAQSHVPSDPTDRKSSSRVLVTGATGFLGRAVAKALDRAGLDVLRGGRIAPAAAPTGEPWIGYGAVGPVTRWDDVLAGIDVVVHLAGLAHLPDAMSASAADTLARVNAEGTARLASAAVGARVRRLVLMSSALVHGEASERRPFTEADQPAPASPYARSKLDSERRLVAAARGSPLQWVILRSPMVYGAGAQGNFRRLVGLVRTGLPLPLGAATAPRTFIGIDNLADAVVRCVEHPRAANQVFLVGDAETTSTADLIHRIAGALGRRVWTPRVSPALLGAAFRMTGRERDFHRLFDPLALDTNPIRTLLDWSPPVSLDEGLRRAVRELRE